MSPPIFHLDDEVEIIGVRCDGQAELAGKRFKISQYHVDQDGERCSAIGFPWYPASSLRLVEEELKIGDWVESVGPTFINDVGNSGQIFQIRHRNVYADNVWAGSDTEWYPAKSLRKLTPEEIQQHTGTIGYQAQKCNAELEKAKEAMREILAPLVDERLSAIEKRLDKLGSSHSELMGDVEAVAEKMGAIEKRLTVIEKRQRKQSESLSDLACSVENIEYIESDLRAMTQTTRQMQKEIDVLKGEMPEVCEPAMNDIGAIAAIASFGPVPECVAAFIRHETEEAEKRKLEGGDCHPNDELILISIQRGGEMHTDAIQCPAEAMAWCEKVLDSMRGA